MQKYALEERYVFTDGVRRAKIEAESTYVFVWVIQTLNSGRAMSISRHVSGGFGSIIPTGIQSRFLFRNNLKEIAIRCV